MTEDAPEGMDMSPQAAAKRAADFDEFFGRYNVLRYKPDDDDDASNAAAIVQRFSSAVKSNLKLMNRGGRPIDIEIGLLAAQDVNAYAAFNNGTYLIAIHQGVNMRIGMAVAGMVADGRAFPEFGKEYFDGPFHFEPDFLRNGHIGKHVPYSPDAELLELGAQISHCAELFLVFHELAHIRNGHLDWYNQEFGLAAVDERKLLDTAGLGRLQRQTLEWDADCWAVKTLFHGQIKIQLAKMGRLGETLAGPRIPEIAAVITRVMFGLWIVYKLFEPMHEVADDLDSILEGMYPPPRNRALMAVAMMFTVLVRSCGADQATYSDDVSDSVVRAELAWLAMTREPAEKAINEAAYLAGRDLLHQYSICWRDLHPELDRLKLGPSIAPAWDEWDVDPI